MCVINSKIQQVTLASKISPNFDYAEEASNTGANILQSTLPV